MISIAPIWEGRCISRFCGEGLWYWAGLKGVKRTMKGIGNVETTMRFNSEIQEKLVAMWITFSTLEICDWEGRKQFLEKLELEMLWVVNICRQMGYDKEGGELHCCCCVSWKTAVSVVWFAKVFPFQYWGLEGGKKGSLPMFIKWRWRCIQIFLRTGERAFVWGGLCLIQCIIFVTHSRFSYFSIKCAITDLIIVVLVNYVHRTDYLLRFHGSYESLRTCTYSGSLCLFSNIKFARQNYAACCPAK